jgi:hypothetical protein
VRLGSGLIVGVRRSRNGTGAQARLVRALAASGLQFTGMNSAARSTEGKSTRARRESLPYDSDVI